MTENPDSYPPIAEHGMIGDMRTAALVSTRGGIDWFCCPRFDSPSVFASLLDPERGGHWTITPTCEVSNTQQNYFPESNILVTRFLTVDGVVEVQDFMPVLRAHDPDHRQLLVRRVVAVRGSMRMRVTVDPRMDYGRAAHSVRRDERGIWFLGADLELCLRTSVDLRHENTGGAAGEFRIAHGETELFVLEVLEPGDHRDPPPDRPADVEGLFDATAAFWRGWLSACTYTGRWREMVQRSALTLKMLTYEPTGAIIAAPTTSLPERIGGERNWDYRRVWLRDAAFSLYALLQLGFTEEAEAFTGWLCARFRAPSDEEFGPLRVMYTVDGDSDPTEEELRHLAGYRGSAPVRIGNAASEQLQLDVYGEIFDALYLFDKYDTGLSLDTWRHLTETLDWLCTHWDRPDAGIWEKRGVEGRHTFFRLMTWVAIERMIRMARRRGLPGDIAEWTRARDTVHRQILEEGWNEELKAFTQRLGEPILDASMLLMPMVKFTSPTDPRFLSTLEAIEEHLTTDSLVFRYDADAVDDGMDAEEGTFSLCSFWYAEALTRAGRLEDARLVLEKMFTYANHLGLYSEQIGLSGDQLGNFPQAFTHLGLISAALNLDRALG
ncbi:glycoside hydrolase family 15 protein [Marinactinospora thermotolerans]|uniref:glycoside hydrolase family 15 protein n=1 Tax=Marinactinospora thermotolerans TaxID=531310 RepID=UPI003D8A6D2F